MEFVIFLTAAVAIAVGLCFYDAGRLRAQPNSQRGSRSRLPSTEHETAIIRTACHPHPSAICLNRILPSSADTSICQGSGRTRMPELPRRR